MDSSWDWVQLLRQLLLLKVLLHVGWQITRIGEVRPEVFQKLVDVGSKLLAQILWNEIANFFMVAQTQIQTVKNHVTNLPGCRLENWSLFLGNKTFRCRFTPIAELNFWRTYATGARCRVNWNSIDSCRIRYQLGKEWTRGQAFLLEALGVSEEEMRSSDTRTTELTSEPEETSLGMGRLEGADCWRFSSEVVGRVHQSAAKGICCSQDF